jgi:hypothetical protein
LITHVLNAVVDIFPSPIVAQRSRVRRFDFRGRVYLFFSKDMACE